jgi:lysophospholipase L1-like esterase
MTVRIAALGDSLTLGMGDPVPGQAGQWRGFAALLAGSSPAGKSFRNFARAGALCQDVLTDQLPPALAWQPHLATVLIGANDTLRGSFNVSATAHRLSQVIGALSQTGAVVLTACLPDPGRMLALPQALARPLARRIGAVNAIVHALTDRHQTAHVHLATDPLVYQPPMWSVDRLHPNERGHRHLARLCHKALTQHFALNPHWAFSPHHPLSPRWALSPDLPHGPRWALEPHWALGPPPGAEPEHPGPRAGAQVWWMATKGTRWLADRSRDLIPQLLSLALTEWHLSRQGLCPDLDRHTEAEILAALSTMDSATNPALTPMAAATT